MKSLLNLGSSVLGLNSIDRTIVLQLICNPWASLKNRDGNLCGHLHSDQEADSS